MTKSMQTGSKWVAAINLARVVPLLLAGCLTGCLTGSAATSQTAHQPSPMALYSQPWQSTLYLDHPLVGKLWDSAANRFIDGAELEAAIVRASYVLLGEKHDNPDHHAMQGQLLASLFQQHRVARLAFEMLDSASQERLDQIYTQRPETLAELKTYLDWDEEGWDWTYYGPLLQAGYQAGVPLFAANIDTDTMRAVYASELPAAIATVLDAEVTARLNQDVDESHCGLLPESQFPAMVRVQQSRDNAMAQALGPVSNEGVNVLVAGNFHVRRDLGVANYLLHGQPELAPRAIVALGMIEVQPEVTDPADYLEQFNAVRAYDYIWFTPAISDEDYCASLRAGE